METFEKFSILLQRAQIQKAGQENPCLLYFKICALRKKVIEVLIVLTYIQFSISWIDHNENMELGVSLGDWKLI